MLNAKNLLEIVAFSLESCQIAQAGGASRIELCGGRPEGGTTPSIGLLSQALEICNIPIYVMIRPRGGDFLYSMTEIQVMLADIAVLRTLNPAGFVFGALDAHGNLDIEAMEMLIEACSGFPVTFHRAFDMCADPFKCIDELIELGVENILTSGQHQKAVAGLKNLYEYKKYAAGRINIMAGSGVMPNNIQLIANAGINHFHFSATEKINSVMEFKNDTVKMGTDDDFMLYEANINLIREAVEVINSL